MDSAKVLSAKMFLSGLKQGLGTFNVNLRDDRRDQGSRAQTVGRHNGG